MSQPADPQGVGAMLEAVGLLTQGDYVRLRRLPADVQASGLLPDADLDWALALLARSPEPAARSYVMVTLLAVGEITPLPQAQRDRIRQTAAPLLRGTHPLDSGAAARLIQALGP